jgi:hypothetical protein
MKHIFGLLLVASLNAGTIMINVERSYPVVNYIEKREPVQICGPVTSGTGFFIYRSIQCRYVMQSTHRDIVSGYNNIGYYNGSEINQFNENVLKHITIEE